MKRLVGSVAGRAIVVAQALRRIESIDGDVFTCASCSAVLALRDRVQIQNLVIECAECGCLNTLP